MSVPTKSNGENVVFRDKKKYRKAGYRNKKRFSFRVWLPDDFQVCYLKLPNAVIRSLMEKWGRRYMKF